MFDLFGSGRERLPVIARVLTTRLIGHSADKSVRHYENIAESDTGELFVYYSTDITLPSGWASKGPDRIERPVGMDVEISLE